MTEWEVFLIISAITAFVISIVSISIKVSNIIQKNTDSNSALKETLDELKDTLNNLIKNNQEDHDQFNKSINHMKTDIAVLKEKHVADVKRLEEHNLKG